MAGKKYEVYVQKGKPWYKHVTGILFSQLGLFFLCLIYAVGGKKKGAFGLTLFFEIYFFL